MKRLLIFLFALSSLVGLAAGQKPTPSQADAPHLYVVLYEMKFDGNELNLRLRRIFEPLLGGNVEAPVDLPPGFVEAAKKQIEAEKGAGKLNGEGTLTSFLYVPKPVGEPELGLSSLNGIWGHLSNFELKGQSCQSYIYSRPIGKGILFFTYYAAPLSKNTAEERAALVTAELERSARNVSGGEIVSKETFSRAGQTILDAIAKTLRNRSLSIRTRYICNERLFLALGYTGPAEQDPETEKALSKLFENFHFKE